MKSNRRSFLKGSLAATAALGWTAKSWARVKGANETLNVATIGFRSRGNSHIGGMLKLAPEGVRMAALCDVDSKVLEKGVASLKKKGEDPKAYSDLRQVMEDKDIDVVTIATPNHWHALAAIWAIQAGKDVYVEKPVSHNVWEGRKIVEAARKYDRIVQTGTQSRSSTGIKQAVEYVQSGALGKIEIVRGLCYKPRLSIGRTQGDQKVPEGLDYDLWCGPAPLVPPHRNNPANGPIHYDWHWVWDYGNGDLGNQGIHQMDIARWFLGADRLAPRVFSVGGRLGYEDDGETPNTQIVYQEYDDAPLIFEVRGLPKDAAALKKGGRVEMDDYMGARIGVIIHCEGGYVVVPSYTKATAFTKDGKEIQSWSGAVDHFDNFIGAVRTRDHRQLNADIWEGHLSSALCHTGNISYRLGSQEKPAAMMEKMKGHRGAEETLGRMLEHLGRHDIDLTKNPLTLGRMLQMDPETEKFIGDQEADRMLTREYRKPFVVPDHV